MYGFDHHDYDVLHHIHEGSRCVYDFFNHTYNLIMMWHVGHES